MINKRLKQLLLAGLVINGTILGAKALMSAYEVSGNISKNRRFDTPLDEDEKNSILEFKSHEINSVLEQIKELFAVNSELTDEDIKNIKEIDFSTFDISSKKFLEYSFELTYPEKLKKYAFVKFFFAPSGSSNVKLVMRLLVNDWSGYLDLDIVHGRTVVMGNEFHMLITDIHPIINAPLRPNLGDIVSFERFIYKNGLDSHAVLQNIKSKFKFETTLNKSKK